jgi:8-oxo-dGTP diphosphatase
MKNPEVIRVCAAVLRNDAKVLMCSRPAGRHLAGCWEFPGGKVHPGETDDECLRREIREELSVDILVLDQIGSTLYAYPVKNVEILFYRVFMVDDSQKITATENQDHAWIDARKILELELVPADTGFADWLASGIE